MDKKTIIKIVKQYIQFLVKKGYKIRNVFLFGSYSQEEFS